MEFSDSLTALDLADTDPIFRDDFLLSVDDFLAFVDDFLTLVDDFFMIQRRLFEDQLLQSAGVIRRECLKQAPRSSRRPQG